MTQKKKIKILFRHRSMEMGGVEKVMLSILRNLDQNKFEITVLLSLNQGELRNEIPSHVRKVYLADGREDLSKNVLIQKLQLFRRKNKLVKLLSNPGVIDNNILKDSFDIEVGMTYNDFQLVLNSTNNKSKKIAWFHSEINTPGLQPLVSVILEQFTKFDTIVYCSQRIKEILHVNYPKLSLPEEHVIVNSIPVDEIISKSKETIQDFPNTKNPVFVSLGRLHNRKGYHNLIDVHKKLNNEGLKHTIIVLGDGEERENLTNKIKENKVEESFILLGNRMNPYPYIKLADFFILPSRSEAWPLVIAEALILQKPIIATDTGDVSKMISHNKTGYVVKYDNGEIYDAMKLFLSKENIIIEIKNNLKNIEDQFDNRKIFDKIEEVFTNLYNHKNAE